jgi:hypothetical protein
VAFSGRPARRNVAGMRSVPPIVPEDLNGRRERRSLHRGLTAIVLNGAPSSRISPEDFVRRNWPEDAQAARIVRAASAPASTTNAGALQLSAAGVFRSLAPTSAAIKLFDLGLVVDLSGLASVRIPSITTALPDTVFVGEGQPAPALNLSLSASQVGPIKKLTLIAAVSEELETSGPELASSVVGRVLSDAVTKGMDAAAFSNFAGDAITPAGLLHGVTPVAAAAAGAAAMGEDLGALAASIAGANIDVNDLVYVASPRLAIVIKVNASPKFDNLVLSSLAMPDKSIAAFAPAAIISALGDLPSIETTKQAVVNFETNPLEIVAAGGAVAAPTYSVFQMGLIAIKVRADAAWTCIPGGAAIINSVNW